MKVFLKIIQYIVLLHSCVHVCIQWNTRHGEVLSHSEFYVPTVSQVVDFVEDFFNWINPKEHVRIYSPHTIYCIVYIISTDFVGIVLFILCKT